MRLSQLFSKTSRDVPADETSLNAQLFIRAGYITKTMAGVYAMLPLGLKMLNKIEAIVRTKMNNIGGQEVSLNALHPKEWWLQSGRWSTVDILFKLNSQTGTEYALAPSHEEQVVPIAKQFIQSWKDLPEYDQKSGVFPLSIYQIQTKFRDELRSKAGLMRGREFRMKDMYDFHTSEESRAAYYESVKQAYLDAYSDMELKAYVVQASGGIFTQKLSHEFQVVCSAGEDKTLLVPGTTIAYNQDVAPAKISDENTVVEFLPREDMHLPGIIGVNALYKVMDVDVAHCIKTLFYIDKNNVFVVTAIRADRQFNEEKLQKLHAMGELSLASPETVLAMTGAEIGYAGLVDLIESDTLKIYIDDSCENLTNFECGTNKTNFHSKNVNFGRDIPPPAHFVDIKVAYAGDIHPESGQKYEMVISAEAGNIFDLGTRYTEAFDIRYTDKNNTMQYPIMGCHGLGITRTMGLLGEIHNDDKGLCLPETIAPYHYHLISWYGEKDTEFAQDMVRTIANKFYADHADVVLYDDRIDKKIGIGSKLADADLIGCPVQIIVSTRNLAQGVVEVKNRKTGEINMIPVDQIDLI